VLLNGARQTGKSTLARQAAAQRSGQYLTLDDPATAGLARSDPSALIQGAGAFTVIDEVQHAPELFPAIKRAVDALFAAAAWRTGSLPLERADVCKRVIAGGFPEAVARSPGERRDAWFRSYIASLLQRDVRDLANIEGLTDMPRLLGLLAARSSALLNMSEVSRAAGIAHSTLRRYLALLEAAFIFQPLAAWSANIGKRLVKSPKIHLLDSGLAAHLRGDMDARALAQSPNLGPLLETFVVQEVRRLLGWSRLGATPYHFRTAAGQEVDLLLEAPGQRIAGIEVKASANVGQGDFDGLRALSDAAGDKFARGVVLYFGEQRLSFADNLWALPIASLWESA